MLRLPVMGSSGSNALRAAPQRLSRRVYFLIPGLVLGTIRE